MTVEGLTSPGFETVRERFGEAHADDGPLGCGSGCRRRRTAGNAPPFSVSHRQSRRAWTSLSIRANPSSPP